MCFARLRWSSCLPVLCGSWRVAWPQQNALCYRRLLVQSSVLPPVTFILFFAVHITTRFFYSSWPFSPPLLLSLCYIGLNFTFLCGLRGLQWLSVLSTAPSCEGVLCSADALYSLHREVVRGRELELWFFWDNLSHKKKLDARIHIGARRAIYRDVVALL